MIYLSQGHKKYIDFLESLGNKKIGISIVSYIETMVGIQSEYDFSDISIFLNEFEIVDLDKNTSDLVIKFLRQREKKSLRDPGFADIIIASIAINYDIPIVTNNEKDFKMFKGLKIIKPV